MRMKISIFLTIHGAKEWIKVNPLTFPISPQCNDAASEFHQFDSPVAIYLNDFLALLITCLHFKSCNL